MSGKTAFIYNDFNVVLYLGDIAFHFISVDNRDEAIAVAMRWEMGIE